MKTILKRSVLAALLIGVFTMGARAQKLIIDKTNNLVFISCAGMPAGSNFAYSSALARWNNSSTSNGYGTTSTLGLSSAEANLVLSSKFQIAKTDVSLSITWAQAMSLPISTLDYNSFTAIGVTAPAATPATGCAGYSEGSYGAGMWRVPTQRELMLIWIFNTKLTTGVVVGFTPFGASSYWSSTESAAYGAWYVHFSLGRTSDYDKTSTTRVRCVRDVTP